MRVTRNPEISYCLKIKGELNISNLEKTYSKILKLDADLLTARDEHPSLFAVPFVLLVEKATGWVTLKLEKERKEL